MRKFKTTPQKKFVGMIILFVGIPLFLLAYILFVLNWRPGFDTVVISEKMSPIREVSKLLKNSKIEFHFIGDAKTPRHLMYCISEAQEMIR